MCVKVKYKILGDPNVINHDVRPPSFAHKDDSCADLYSPEEFILAPGEIKKVGFGFAMEVPIGYEWQIRPRSSISARGIHVAFGSGDAGYRGEVGAVLVNLSNTDWYCFVGARIAQLAVRPIPQIMFEEVYELSNSDRGTKGWGSTGV